MGYTVVVNLTTLLDEVCDLYMAILIVFLKLKILSCSQIINSYPLKSSKMLPERPHSHDSVWKSRRTEHK